MFIYVCCLSRFISDFSCGCYSCVFFFWNGDGDGIFCFVGKVLKLWLVCFVVGIVLFGSGWVVFFVGKVGGDIGEWEEVVCDVGYGGCGCWDGGDEVCGCGVGIYSVDVMKWERRVNG